MKGQEKLNKKELKNLNIEDKKPVPGDSGSEMPNVNTEHSHDTEKSEIK